MVDTEQQSAATWQEWIADTPPGKPFEIHSWFYPSSEMQGSLVAHFPDIEIPCRKCRVSRLFGVNVETVSPDAYLFLIYRCKSCESEVKTFAIRFCARSDGSARITKLGEFPAFEVPSPPGLRKLLGFKNYSLFQQGMRAESLGMGIGAYSYYRRVVESQKDKIFDRIIEVAESVGEGNERIEQLKAAKQGYQFSRQVKSFKEFIPEALLIRGQNPLTLLNKALSAGLHARSDQECLELANTIRLVLADLVEQSVQALKKNEELTAAVSKLLNPTPPLPSPR